MNTNDFKIFEAVAITGSFTKAANQMHTVQSNVTARIRILEQEFKTSLFIRDTKHVHLTEAGKKLLPFAKKMEVLIQDAKSALQDKIEITGCIRIGSLENTAALRLPSIIALYTNSYPYVSLKLMTGTTHELIEDVLPYKLDGAFVAGPVAGDLLSQEMVVEEELVLVTHKSLTTEKEIIKNANQIKIIVFKLGCSYRQRLEMVLSQWGIINYSILEFGSLEGIINCVASGVGISILPRAVVQLYKNKSMVAHKIPKSIALVKTIFIRRKENLPRNLDLFSKMIKVQLKTGKRR